MAYIHIGTNSERDPPTAWMRLSDYVSETEAKTEAQTEAKSEPTASGESERAHWGHSNWFNWINLTLQAAGSSSASMIYLSFSSLLKLAPMSKEKEKERPPW